MQSNKQLTEHFSLAELTVTDTGLNNDLTPEMQQTGRLTQLAIFLEKIRAYLGGYPVYIDSAYRNPEVNAAVGGVPDSAHMEGEAADIRCPDHGTPYAVALALKEADRDGVIDVDQIIYEQTWVHVSRAPQLRHEYLTHTGGDNYVAGIVGP